MSGVIGSSAVSGSSDSYPSRAALNAEMAQYKKQLADCVNCPTTSSSLEGKSTIQDLSSKISADQARIRHIEAARTVDKASNAELVQPAKEVSSYTAAGSVTSFTDASKGGLVNLFA